jgi:hypothetical protein
MEEVFEDHINVGGIVSSMPRFFDPGVQISALHSRVRSSGVETANENIEGDTVMSVVARGQRYGANMQQNISFVNCFFYSVIQGLAWLGLQKTP